MDVRKGDIVAGKYRIERVLGRGGMGLVVAATHLQLEQIVALKFLLPAATQNPGMLARFAREARAAARIRNEHVVRVVDVDTLPTGVPYIVMEYLEGTDLSAYLKERGRLSTARAAELILEACEGLAEAHSLGIVHRDLKPANLFLARSPDGTTCLKVLDFGISKDALSSQREAELSMTRTGAVMGSPFYMPPEQMRSTRTVDSRADIWSLGVVLYELVAGHVPFQGPTLPQLCAMILSDPPPPLEQSIRATSPRFEALIARCLDKEPAHRFQGVAELAVALAEFVSTDPERALDRIARFSRPSTAATDGRDRTAERSHSTRTDWGRTSRRASRDPGRSLGVRSAVVSCALLAGLASWVLFRQWKGPAREVDHASEIESRRNVGSASAPGSAPPVGSARGAAPAEAAKSGPVAAPGETLAPSSAAREPMGVPSPPVARAAKAPPRHVALPPAGSPEAGSLSPLVAPTSQRAAPDPLDGRQ